MTKINGGPKLPNQLQIATQHTQAQQIQGTNTVQTTQVQGGLELNQAWQKFATVNQQAPLTGSAQVQGGMSVLRQQMQLAQMDAAPSFDPAQLAQHFGIDPSALALSESTTVSTQQSLPQGAVIASPGETVANPIANPRTPAGPAANPARGDARAAFEAVLEQSYMPFDTKSDNMARDLAQDGRLMGALNVAEKGRMLQIMGSGVRSEADNKAMLQTLDSAQSKQEFFSMLQAGGGLNNITAGMSPKDARHLNFLADKYMTHTGPAKSPERAEARQKFEQLLERQHQPFDTKADNLVRELTTNPTMLGALTPAEKGRMLQILGSGWKGEADEEAAISILRSSKDANDFFSTVQYAGGAHVLDGMLDWKEQGQFNFLKEKFGTMAMQSPQSFPDMGNYGNVGGNYGNYGNMGGYGDMGQFNMPTNCWGLPPVGGMGNYGMGQMPYNMGMGTGMGMPQDFGFGRSGGSVLGGLFRGIVGGLGKLFKAALPALIGGGVGFLMGGPAGAAMGALNGLFGGGLGSMLGGGDAGMGGLDAFGSSMPGSDITSMLFNTLLNNDAPGGGLASLMGALAQ